MEVAGKTAEELLNDLVDIGETNKWEFKSPEILIDKTKHHLARQVSAFANSGGGFIAIGINEVVKGKEYSLQACETIHGKRDAPMKDYLGTIVSGSVEPALRQYTVHQLRFREGSDEYIFVIELGDSAAAPHQVYDKSCRRYFWRNGTETEAAPHHYLELLRNRVTKAVLEIVEIEFHPEIRTARGDDTTRPSFKIALFAKVKNCSWQSASNMGIHLRTPKTRWRWQLEEGGFNHYMDEGACAHGPRQALLPDETIIMKLSLNLFFAPLEGYSKDDVKEFFTSVWRTLDIELRPVSQDHIGTTYHFPEKESDIRYKREEDFGGWMRVFDRE